MLLIYIQKNSPRFLYIVKHIFNNLLNIDFEITLSLEEFQKSDKPKISYAENRIENELFIKSSHFLYERGIFKPNLEKSLWKGIPCFFLTEKADIPFDIFSASFFLLSRYEEYYASEKKEYKTYDFQESTAFKFDFLEIPIVDFWVKELGIMLKEKYPELQTSTPIKRKKNFNKKVIIEIQKTYQYKNKGFFRNFGRFFKNLFAFKKEKLVQQIKVLFGKEKDPYDIYNELVEFFKERKDIFGIFFFLIGDYTAYDRNVSYNNLNFKNLLKYISDYANVSVLGSYDSVFDAKKLKAERIRMKHILHRPVKRFKSRNCRNFIPEIYRNLVEAGYNQDFTMGYTHTFGFRAGTSKPFDFYDVGLEVALPLKIVPFCMHSDYFKNYSKKQILEKSKVIQQNITSCNGDFTIVFSGKYLQKNLNFYTSIFQQ